MINKNPDGLRHLVAKVRINMLRILLDTKEQPFYSQSELLGHWTLAGIYFRDDVGFCRCGGQCNVMAILYYFKGKLRYDCPACWLIDIPHLNPIPIEESYQLLLDNPDTCIKYEALMFCLNIDIITVEDYAYYSLIPFTKCYELNPCEVEIVQRVNTAFTTHIKECYSKYEIMHKIYY